MIGIEIGIATIRSSNRSSTTHPAIVHHVPDSSRRFDERIVVPRVRRPAGMHEHRVQVIDRLGVSPGACLRAQEGPQVERGREVDLLVDFPAETPVKALELYGEDGGRTGDRELLVGAHFLAAPAVEK